MDTERQDQLMDSIKAARPARQPSAQEWVEGERGQRVLERVLAQADAAAQTAGKRQAAPIRVRGRLRRTYWVVAAAAAVVVVGLSVGLALVDWTGGSDGVAQGPQTTADGTVADESSDAVTRSSAVQNVTLLLLIGKGWVMDSVDAQAPDAAALLAIAVDEGLITPAEAAEGATQPMSEGQYAVLLWAAFGTAFPDVFDSGLPAVSLVGEADAEMLAAVEGLRRVGVLRYSDGAMDVDQPLLPARERLLLSRTEAALRGETLE